MLEPGTQFGQYKIRRLVGRGGMADVYDADLQAGDYATKRVALKLLLPHLSADDRIIECFVEEARLAGGLSHPNIVQVFDFGEHEGTLYLAMEFVDGMDLHRSLRLCAELGQRMPVPAALYVAHEVCLALSYIHQLKPPIIHRDVTPQNVFFTREGHVRLGDFGVAKSEASSTVTEAGVVKGKIAYLAPEQARGEPVCRRTDVFAAGLMLFEMLTGQRLIRGANDLQMVLAAQSPKLVAPSRLNPAAAPVDRLVLTALQPSLERRLRSAEQFTLRLEQLLDQSPFDAAALAAWLGQLEQGANQAQIPTMLETGDEERSDVATLPIQLSAERASPDAIPRVNAATGPRAPAATADLSQRPLRESNLQARVKASGSHSPQPGEPALDLTREADPPPPARLRALTSPPGRPSQRMPAAAKSTLRVGRRTTARTRRGGSDKVWWILTGALLLAAGAAAAWFYFGYQ